MPKTKKIITDILLAFIEVDETADFVISQLLKGFDHKTPKTKQQCVEIIKDAVK